MNLLKKLMEPDTDTPSEPSGPAVPTLGKYRIVREIARGGGGIVFEALDPELNRRVALKVLKPESAESAPVVERLFREAKIAAQLRHPNIVAVHEIGSVPHPDGPTAYFIAMDFLPGRTLAEVMPSLNRRERLQVLEVVARAVGYAHQNGVVHRDLKPQNVIMEELAPPDGLRWRITLTDFGLAKTLEGDTLTRAWTVMGTTYYMAPEQVQGQVRKTGPWTDVWALGVILYDMLADRKPFEGSTSLNIFDQIVRREPVPPRHLSPSVHPDLETVCMKALEKEMAQRYAGGTEFADELKRYLADEPVLARPARWPKRLWRKIRKHPVISGLAAAASLLVLAAAGVAVSQYLQAVRERTQSDRRFTELMAEKAEKERRRRVEDALRPASVLLDRWELSGRNPAPDDERRIMEALMQGAQVYPESGPWHMEQGRWWWMKDDLVRARNHFTQAMKDAPVKFLAHYYRARVLLTQYSRNRPSPRMTTGNPRQAVRYENVRTEDENDRTLREAALKDLGEFKKRMGPNSMDQRIPFVAGLERLYTAKSRDDFLEAAKSLEVLGKSGHVGGWEVFYEAGDAYFFAGEFEKAASMFQQAITDGRADAFGWYSLGMATRLMAEQKFARGADPSVPLSNALDYLTRALQIRSDLPAAWNSRGVVLMRQAQVEHLFNRSPVQLLKQAAADYTRAVELQYAPALNNRGLCFWLTGEYKSSSGENPVAELKQAVDDFSRYLKTDPSSSLAYLNRGSTRGTLALYRMSHGEDPSLDLEESLRDLDQAIQVEPDYAEAWRNRGTTFYTLALHRSKQKKKCLNEMIQAEKNLSRALELHPSSGGAYFIRGHLYRLWKKWDQARADYEKAQALDPSLMEKCRPYLLECERQLKKGSF